MGCKITVHVYQIRQDKKYSLFFAFFLFLFYFIFSGSSYKHHHPASFPGWPASWLRTVRRVVLSQMWSSGDHRPSEYYPVVWLPFSPPSPRRCHTRTLQRLRVGQRRRPEFVDKTIEKPCFRRNPPLKISASLETPFLFGQGPEVTWPAAASTS